MCTDNEISLYQLRECGGSEQKLEEGSSCDWKSISGSFSVKHILSANSVESCSDLDVTSEIAYSTSTRYARRTI